MMTRTAPDRAWVGRCDACDPCPVQEERKMTREGFAANNRGIAAGGNLDEAFLNEIFDHIRANPISLKEDDYAREREVALQVGGLMDRSLLVFFVQRSNVLSSTCYHVSR